MKTVYWAVRELGYIAGAAGLILFLLGRQSANPRGPMFVAGAALLIVSFAAFFLSYALYIFQRLSRR